MRNSAFQLRGLRRHAADFPIDVLLYQTGSFEMIEHRYERNDLSRISN
jgi:hypothetical protein